MRTYDTTLLDQEMVAEGTMAFHFAKPEGFAFKAGQAVDLILPEVVGGDAEQGRRTFSLVSAPFENRLTVATRLRDSDFKRILRALAPGAPLRFEGPSGSLTLHNNRARPAVLIAGGIGITPFICMLRQAAHEQLPQDLLLLYSNRRPEDAAFLDELQELKRRNGRFRMVATMTQMGKSSRTWAGRSGPLDAELLRQVGSEQAQAIYYLAGPPALVEAMRQALGQAGIDSDDVRSEEFYGY